MGTSSSSSGPKSKVRFDPPWLSLVVSEIEEHISGESSQQPESVVQPLVLAPLRRFRNARQYLGEYAGGGDRDILKKALKNYSRKGMGGVSNVAKRMRVSTSMGAGLFTFLQEVHNSSDVKVKNWVSQLIAKNLTAYEVADEIINQVISTGGSLEEESCRNSIAQAISDLLMIYPNIDLLNIDNDKIWIVMELFMANEAFNRLNLDIGQLFESSKYSPQKVVSKINDMREYIKAEISVQIKKLKKITPNPTKVEMNNLLQTAIKNTFEVFEE